MNTSKTSMLHLGLFSFSLLGEINNLRKHYQNKDKNMLYISATMSQLELLSELVFEHLNEKVEPLIYFMEAIKVLLKLKEYSDLITKEKMSCYISKERYEEHKKVEEKNKSMLMLPRSKKHLPKPDKFNLSSNMLKYALKNVNSIDSMQSQEDSNALQSFSNSRNNAVSSENDETKPKGMLAGMFHRIVKKFRWFLKLMKSRKFNVSEILLILRPFIYMYMLLKLGKSSYKPFLVSLAIEIIAIIQSTYRMATSRTETEKEELKSRWRNLFKYFLKEPFFSKYTVRIVYTVLRRIISDGKIGYVLSLLTYFKYYSYIA